jgi:hypothetical protein
MSGSLFLCYYSATAATRAMGQEDGGRRKGISDFSDTGRSTIVDHFFAARKSYINFCPFLTCDSVLES